MEKVKFWNSWVKKAAAIAGKLGLNVNCEGFASFIYLQEAIRHARESYLFVCVSPAREITVSRN